jgi:Ser/Thr protein kinase RdoA (MazF antagonist)
MLTRSGTDRLPAHLETAYGIEVDSTAELDLGVFKIGRRDGPAWVARVFPRGRPAGAAVGDAAILDFLATSGFPAERPAAPNPVSVLDHQDVLVTGYVEAVPGNSRAEAVRRLGGFVRLGAMLAGLHRLPDARGAVHRAGGAWHHLADGSPSAEVAAAAALLAAAGERVTAGERPAYEQLRAEVADFDAAEGLPEALIHPDFVLANAIATPEPGGELVMVDWTGAGIGPRLWPLAFLLYSAGARGTDRTASVVRGYTRYVRPEPEEMARLASVMRVRPSVLQVWAFCTGRKSAPDAAQSIADVRAQAAAIAARAHEAFRAAH